uniref:Spen paralogue and orthologue SPOC C-terminal domain-containing protein n=1 Tax=Ananas comosus var. bracteatus TaxID=296719 RepID=A0A6V7P538_ANACO|nr:unnamed protein product [Ananas comosus var. bracteatus]
MVLDCLLLQDPPIVDDAAHCQDRDLAVLGSQPWADSRSSDTCCYVDSTIQRIGTNVQLHCTNPWDPTALIPICNAPDSSQPADDEILRMMGARAGIASTEFGYRKGNWEDLRENSGRVGEVRGVESRGEVASGSTPPVPEPFRSRFPPEFCQSTFPPDRSAEPPLHPAAALIPLLTSKVATFTTPFNYFTPLFFSGEKTQGIKWPKLVEIKGKVRLQAFEKFIQELPRSRNRSLMVISLCWKVGSSNSGLTGMKEVANGYRESEKVGFAHICSGYDLYVCPRSDKIITILAKHGFFKGIMAVEEDQDSMIGCVIWRRSHKSSNTGPKASDGTKNSSEKLLLSDEPSAVEVKCPLAESTPCSRESEGRPSWASPFPPDVLQRVIHSCVAEKKEPTKIPLNVPPPLVLQAKEAPHCPDDDDDLPEFDFSDACGVRVKNLVSNLPSPLNRQLQVEKANMSGFAPPEARNMKLNDVLDPAPPTSSFGAESLNARERFQCRQTMATMLQRTGPIQLQQLQIKVCKERAVGMIAVVTMMMMTCPNGALQSLNKLTNFNLASLIKCPLM